jgi:hypothetical protein
VIWRRISGSTANEWVGWFVELMLTVVAACRQQGRNVLEHLTSYFEADPRGLVIPSLRPVTEPAIKVARFQQAHPVSAYRVPYPVGPQGCLRPHLSGIRARDGQNRHVTHPNELATIWQQHWQRKLDATPI